MSIYRPVVFDTFLYFLVCYPLFSLLWQGKKVRQTCLKLVIIPNITCCFRQLLINMLCHSNIFPKWPWLFFFPLTLFIHYFSFFYFSIVSPILSKHWLPKKGTTKMKWAVDVVHIHVTSNSIFFRNFKSFYKKSPMNIEFTSYTDLLIWSYVL